ncbi:MAG: hypothetical protein PHG96_02220 [Kiritimatiellae bacterium]|nr:hypothetical protein [Kiritimatiellia bacterium]MDD3544158.1 hypothetical protein [Kiritimatiellia bacterium]MDD4026230.1 hypothetical protein [Kiritimatiellia bacterium]MDD4622245.1 hypothetical protein [Kiritimatiellia bacterium]
MNANLERFILASLVFLSAVCVSPACAQSLTAWTSDAGSSELNNGSLRLVAAVGQGQPVEVLGGAGGGLVLYQGYLGGVSLFTNLDHDADGLYDEIDADNDNDGLADIDELAGTCFPVTTPTEVNVADSDGDGADDGDEAVMNSNPRDAESLLRLTHIQMESDGSVALAWQAQEGVMYTVLWGISPRASDVTNALPGTVTANGGEGPWGDTETDVNFNKPTASNAFFRVRIVP